MKARVLVSLKAGVLDPQGKAIERALSGLGFSGVGEVRQGKHIEIELAEADPAAARAALEQMCQKLLANTVIETYRIELGDGPATSRTLAPKAATPKAATPRAAAPKRAAKAGAKPAAKSRAKPTAKPAPKAAGRSSTKAQPRSKSATAKRR